MPAAEPIRRGRVTHVAQEETTMTTLRTNMISDMTVRGLSESTQESYLRAVTGLAANR